MSWLARLQIHRLQVQVLIGIVAGVALGLAVPATAVAMKPFGDAFVALLRMLIGPIVFFTVVHSLAAIKDMRRLGRLAFKTLVYFEVVSTIAMLLGFAAVNIVQPGQGLHASVFAAPLPNSVASSEAFSFATFLLHIIPANPVDAFARGDVLQVLFISVIAGLALGALREPESVLVRGIEEGQRLLFIVLDWIMRFAPLGAFGAMAATVGGYGGAALAHLAEVVVLFFACAALFVLVVLGAVAALARLSIFRILGLIREEIMLVFSTSSSEVAFPRLMQKLTRAGCDETVVGFVLPAGYSFNLDGTSLYMAIGVGFIAQATDTPFPWTAQLALLAVLLLTSKGGATVAGGSFIKLAATLQSTRALPLSGLGLLFGVDRFMALCGGLTNMIGNAVAVLVIARWEGAFDRAKFDAACRRDALALAADWPGTPADEAATAEPIGVPGRAP
ncbi:cation:dicarboxylase symporter family transporter [Bradyrhizobium sp. U87765 SZCCT0131]|nr:cation:dicarboxylase symporter family transporter [Bradyrhizobium sp. U87765 SZCCT0131]MBR1263130.1 cation:dicarboxylase symporter family transporter [Bradyrhizobium sp. U87765 SZCCT0134]MBR1306987.1 cation:dicarboxylase symporter family transporter [Bradyrhizobium sp. U87765 SZCCT0110]MBR1323125.1 cation:dicarboxylase symporter family transporter [Bradyrhizobium sp. U87765 SZCCT0109]MBR1345941.1 cation:dicarboxylase symporter family transporter [Bradyrhizobium sp. U87765 SZCCT0048]